MKENFGEHLWWWRRKSWLFLQIDGGSPILHSLPSQLHSRRDTVDRDLDSGVVEATLCCASLGPLSSLKSTLCFGSVVSPPYLVAESKVSTLYLCVLCSDMNSSALGTLEPGLEPFWDFLWRYQSYSLYKK